MHRKTPFSLTALLIIIVASTSRLLAQPVQNEEVLFFDGLADQTATENGGVVILPIETQVWRFWFQDVFHAAISPDAKKVAYRYLNSINIADINGLNPKTLAFDLPGSPFSWSPSNDRIAFFSGADLIVMDMDGNQTVFEDKGVNNYFAPSWSPDGLKLAYTAEFSPESGTTKLRTVATIDFATGEETLIYEPSLVDDTTDYSEEHLDYPVWSPQGDRIAVLKTIYERSKVGQPNPEYRTWLTVMPASGGTPTNLVGFPIHTEDVGLPIYITGMAWSPDGSEIAYVLDPFAVPNLPSATFGIYRASSFNGSPTWISSFLPRHFGYTTGQNTATAFQWATLNPGSNLRVSLVPSKAIYDKDESLDVKITVTHGNGNPATYAFDSSLLTQDPEPIEGDAIVAVENVEKPESFVLSESDPERTFTVPATTLKSGAVNLLSRISVTRVGEDPLTVEDEASIIVAPLTTEVTITNELHHWNGTPESDWGERAQAINQQRRTDGAEPYKNLIEIQTRITNETPIAIENVNMAVAKDILRFVNSQVVGDPEIPLLPIRFYASDGAEADLTDPGDATVVNDVTLQAGETATFAWVLEVNRNAPANRNEPYELRYRAVVTGTLSGTNLRIVTPEIFSILVSNPIDHSIHTDIKLAGDGPELTFTTAPNLSYKIQYKNDMDDLTWLELVSGLIATANETTYLDETFGSLSRRFYRIIAE